MKIYEVHDKENHLFIAVPALVVASTLWDVDKSYAVIKLHKSNFIHFPRFLTCI